MTSTNDKLKLQQCKHRRTMQDAMPNENINSLVLSLLLRIGSWYAVSLAPLETER